MCPWKKTTFRKILRISIIKRGRRNSRGQFHRSQGKKRVVNTARRGRIPVTQKRETNHHVQRQKPKMALASGPAGSGTSQEAEVLCRLLFEEALL